MPKTRVLIIDNDARFVQTLREQLLKQGFEVSSLAEFRDTRFLREVNRPHLVLLDVHTPDADGAALTPVKRIRKESLVPIIIISSKGDVTDRVVGLEAGADDYVVKPCEPRELIARIQSVLRRSPFDRTTAEAETREWKFKGLVVQSNRRKVTLDNEVIELTTAEFDLLKFFASNAQQVLSRDVILEKLRGIEWEAVDRSIDILVSRLRDKLRDDPRRPRFIRTVRSIGYQFIAELDAQ